MNRSAVRAVVGILIEAGLLLGPGVGSTGETQSCDTSTYALSTPSSGFVLNGEGTVTDKHSKLTWMRCSLGQAWENGKCRGAPTALNWNAAQDEVRAVNKSGKFFFADWRIPQLQELAMIAERQCKNPRINLEIFPGTPASYYWSATSRKGDGTGAYALSFGPAGVKYASKDELHDVRLVRNAL